MIWALLAACMGTATPEDHAARRAAQRTALKTQMGPAYDPALQPFCWLRLGPARRPLAVGLGASPSGFYAPAPVDTQEEILRAALEESQDLEPPSKRRRLG